MTALSDHVTAPANLVQIPGKIPTWQQGYSLRLVAVDLVAVILAVAMAQWLRFGSTLPDLDRTGWFWNYSVVSALIATTWMVALSINRSRSTRVVGSGAEEYRRVWLATLSAFGVVAIVSMLFKLEIARGFLMIALPAGLIFLTLGR